MPADVAVVVVVVDVVVVDAETAIIIAIGNC